MNKFKKTTVTLLAAMMLSAGLAPAAFASACCNGDGHHGHDNGSNNGGAGGSGTGGPVACLISIGDLTAAIGLLGSGAAKGEGSSCNSTGIGGSGGNA